LVQPVSRQRRLAAWLVVGGDDASVSRLLDELAEPLDGALVGAEVIAVEGLLGAPVLLGLLLEDPRQRRRGRLRWGRWLAAVRRGPLAVRCSTWLIESARLAV
jgi:hypothetical protein